MKMIHVMMAIPIFSLAYYGLDWLFQPRRSNRSFRKTVKEANVSEGFRELIRATGHNGLNQAVLKIRNYRPRLDMLLMRAGYPFEWNSDDLLVFKEFAGLVAVFILWQMHLLEIGSNPVDWLTGLLTFICGFWALDILLVWRAGYRRVEMQRHLPSFVDLVALAVDGGLDFTVAIERITEKMKKGALREELHVLLQEGRLGSSRKEILMRWANRTGVPDAQSLSSLIIQSEEMGTPLASVLRGYAEDMRVRRILSAEEQAGKIPVKILFPMMLFFFPVVFVIILGPFALQFMDAAK